MSSTLFDLADEYKQLYELAVSEDEEDYQVFLDTLEGLTGEIEMKAEGYTKVINRLSMEQEKAKEIADRYAAHANACKNAISQMKERCMMAMDIMGVTELPAGDLTIKIKKNGGLAPLIITGNVPDNMTRVTVEPDNSKIREYLKTNTCDWAYLAERGRHIEVK